MNYITPAELVTFAGLTYNASTSANIDLTVSAVIKYVDNYLGYSLDEAVISETLDIIDATIIPTRKINKVYSVNEGCEVALTITVNSDEAAISFSEGTVSLNNGVGSNADLTLLSGSVISTVNSGINSSALSGIFTSTITNGSGASYLTIYDGTYQSENNSIIVPYANNKLKYNYRGNSKLITTTDVECGVSRVIYKTGYSETPSDLKFALLKFATLIYNNKTAVGQTISESIGDYSYNIGVLSNSTSDDSIVQINNILNSYMSISI